MFLWVKMLSILNTHRRRKNQSSESIRQSLFQNADRRILGLVVRILDSAINWIVNFLTTLERHKKQMTPGILNLQEIKSDLNFNMGFIR